MQISKINPLITKFKTYGNISSEIEAELNSYTKTFTREKGNFFLKQGQINSGLFVMKQGLIRAFFKKDDKEVNSWFGMENEFIGSILPLFANQPSFEYIQFLEESTFIIFPLTTLIISTINIPN